MAFDTDDPAYRELLGHILRSEAQVVPFVGAGLTAFGDTATRLPLWRELLDRMTAEGRRLGLIDDAGERDIAGAITAGEYTAATDLIQDGLGEPTFRRLVEHELSDRGKPTPPPIQELITIAWPLIVTTNLDHLIARAYLERYGEAMHTVNNLDTHRLVGALAGTLETTGTTLAQLHGDLDVYPSWCLTRAQYQQRMQDAGYVEALKQLFLKRVFFVGFGLQDEDFDLLVELIAQIYPAGFDYFYALVDRSRQSSERLLQLQRTVGLRPIFYDSANAADLVVTHRGAYECLAHLAKAWTAANVTLNVTLKYFPERDASFVGREHELERLRHALLTQRSSLVQVVGLGGLGKTSLVQRFIEDHRPELAESGFQRVFGCSFYRADVGQFVQDLHVAAVGTATVSLPKQVDEIAQYLRAHRTLMVLDGLETAVDADGQLRSPYLTNIVNATIESGGAIIATSRIPICGGYFAGSEKVEIERLSLADIESLLTIWGLDRLGSSAVRRLDQITAGHPLGLRVLAGVLRDVPAQEALRTLEKSAVIDVADQVDPLRENRLARILGSYFEHLSQEEIAFLVSASAFEDAVRYPLVEDALTREYTDSDINLPLVNRDLRPVVTSLLDRRLVTVTPTGELASHPTVRELFAKFARREGMPLAPLHRYLAASYLDASQELPEKFEDTTPLRIACRHAAASGDWQVFDDVFRRRLMRGFQLYLCENLGAWEEALELARLGDDSCFPARLKQSEPCFYPINVARCLKHLGRSWESREKYLEALGSEVMAGDPDVAMYVNNFLTLLIWRGELDAADGLLELNSRALGWIDDPAEAWKRRSQTEQCFTSFGYLRMLQGNFAAAAELFGFADHAWEDYPGERQWFFDYYPYYRSELILLSCSAAFDDALRSVEGQLAVAEEYRWPEAICRGHIQAAVVLVDKATQTRDASALEQARARLNEARLVARGMVVPDAAIAYYLAEIKLILVERDFGGSASHAELDDLLRAAAQLVESSGLALAGPELVAATGASQYQTGALADARQSHYDACALAKAQGNGLAVTSPRSILSWLAKSLAVSTGNEAIASDRPDADLIGAVDRPLSLEWMCAQLQAVTAVPVNTSYAPGMLAVR